MNGINVIHKAMEEPLDLSVKTKNEQPSNGIRSPSTVSQKQILDCDMCGKHFDNKSKLKRHVKGHAGKPCICEVCLKGFTNINALNAHKLVHYSGYPFVCSTCKEKFKESSALYFHSLKHCSDKSHDSNVSGESFPAPGHSITHGSLLRCVECKCNFRGFYEFRNHMNNHLPWSNRC